MDEWSVSVAATRIAGDFRHAFGQRAECRAWIRPLELFDTDRRANLFEMEFVSRRRCSDFTGDPCAHAIGGFVQSGNGSVAQIVIDERGGEGVAGADGVGDM